MTPAKVPTTPYIMLSSGKRFSFEEATVDDIDPYDIILSLSRIPRFGGHGNVHYTVAEHCLLVAELVPIEYRKEALIHDAAEAYTGDVTRPLKMVIGDRYHEIEDRLNTLVRTWAGLPYPERCSDAVKAADLKALYVEGVSLFGKDVVDTWSTPRFPEYLDRGYPWQPTFHGRDEEFVATHYAEALKEALR